MYTLDSYTTTLLRFVALNRSSHSRLVQVICICTNYPLHNAVFALQPH